MRGRGILLLLAFLMSAVPAGAFAQGTPAPVAVNVQGSATPQQLAAFEANPQAFLAANPIGGIQMSTAVKALALADPSAVVDAMLAQAKAANTAQVGAIGSGLGQAVKALQAVDKTLADTLAQKIALASPELLTAYQIGLTDVQTLSVGAGGPGGGVGGPVGGSTGSAAATQRSSAPGNFGTTTTADANFTGGITGGTTFTCTASVSPKKTC